MDKSLSQPDNAELLAERKREWKNVKSNLNKMENIVSHRARKYHKTLFLLENLAVFFYKLYESKPIKIQVVLIIQGQGRVAHACGV